MKRPAIEAGPDADRRLRGFAPGQRRAIVGLVSVFLLATVVGLVRNSTFVGDPMPTAAARFDELNSRLDPNVDDARLLGALPGLGAKRAADIVAYRERVRARDPGRVPFRTPEDLLRVDGVGAAILAQVRPFLRFPDDAATRPAD